MSVRPAAGRVALALLLSVGATGSGAARAERPERVAVELGGGLIGGAAGAFSLGVLTAGVCALTDGGKRSFGCLVPAVAGAYVGGAVGIPLGVWGAGNLMDGDGGLGWTMLGSLSGTAIAATTLVLADVEQGSPLWWTLLIGLPLTGAVLGYELSASDDAPTVVTGGFSFGF